MNAAQSLGGAELHSAILQIVLTLCLALLTLAFRRRFRASYVDWFAAVWVLYVLRLGAIIVFQLTADWIWLYWHQVVTGWTALALLWSALTFSRRVALRPAYLLALLFPPAWSYIAIYRLDNFLLAALPAVLFLTLVTIGTGWVFFRYWQQVRAPGALVLAVALLLWGLHHLDYPFLRARGAWVPWGYYLDIVFTLCVGAAMLLLVQDNLDRGLRARTSELQLLQQRMVQQHEEERRRLSLHLHDQSAQLFAAVKLKLGLMRESAEPALHERLTGVIGLLDEGLAGLRNVVNDLRPSLLDDLGLVPALRSLAAEWESRTGLPVTMDVRELPALTRDAELALYRALQESLSNVAEHSGARRVHVSLSAHAGAVTLDVRDDGRGFPADQTVDGLERAGHLGLAGMRERLAALGGTLKTGPADGGGARLLATVPAAPAEAS